LQAPRRPATHRCPASAWRVARVRDRASSRAAAVIAVLRVLDMGSLLSPVIRPAACPPPLQPPVGDFIRSPVSVYLAPPIGAPPSDMNEVPSWRFPNVSSPPLHPHHAPQTSQSARGALLSLEHWLSRWDARSARPPRWRNPRRPLRAS